MNMGSDGQLSVLIVEAHGAGSHARINSLLATFSRHDIRIIQPDRHHWRKQALTAHYQLANSLAAIEPEWTPDVIVFSGTFSIPALLALAPQRFRAARRIAYFHESQWTYPSPTGDPRAFIVQHLDAVLLSSATWFNSHFHRRVFRAAVTERGADLVPRQTADEVQRKLDACSQVVYPPVHFDEVDGEYQPQRLIWNARWDYDKHPERFIAMSRDIALSGKTSGVLVLGTGDAKIADIRAEIGESASIPGHLPDRASYETQLAGGGIIISTADHEFFGVGVLEAVLAGAVPVLPNDLAYPETLPSAWFYRAGDVADLVRVVKAALDNPEAARTLHQIDATRFEAATIVPVWDDLLDQIARP